MVSLGSLRPIILPVWPSHRSGGPVFAKCKRFFPGIPEHVFRNVGLVCSALILARSTNLNVLKDYLPQLLDNDKTKADSHYKRLIRFFRVATPKGIDFVTRLSEGCYQLLISAASGPAYSKLTRQAYHRKRGVIKQFILNGCVMSIVMLKNPKNEPNEPLLYFISSLTHKVKTTEAYRRRWRIETARRPGCFKHLKTQWFNRAGVPD